MKINKLELFFDLDETIVKFLEPLIDIYNTNYGGNVKLTDITEWSLDKPFNGMARGIYSKPGFFYNLIPYDGAIDTIHKLQDEGFPIYIISHPSGSGIIAKDKIDWVKKYMSWFDINNLILTGHKHRFATLNSVLIDDCSMYLESFKQAGGHTICIDQLYNKDYYGYGIYRVCNNDFSKVYKFIHLINSLQH